MMYSAVVGLVCKKEKESTALLVVYFTRGTRVECVSGQHKSHHAFNASTKLVLLYY
jgi:hypothetical protein